MKLLVRADASATIGTGHVMRCLALAQAFRERGGDSIFLSYCESLPIRKRIESDGFRFIPIQRIHPDPSDLETTARTLSELKKLDRHSCIWIALDGYHLDARYQECLKKTGASILFFDDYGHAGRYHSDLILNQNLGAQVSLYARRDACTRLLLGPSYTLLRREFREISNRTRNIPKIAHKVLITMGGADPGNATLKAIQAVNDLKIPGLEAAIVIGSSNPHLASIQKELRSVNFAFNLYVDAENMAELIKWADLAVAAGGSTSFELAYLGLPSLILVLADNQVNVARNLHEASIALNLGDIRDIDSKRLSSAMSQLIFDQEKRRELSERGQVLIDGKGCLRVVAEMAMKSIVLRLAREEDCHQIWKWSNDPKTRKASFSPESIAWKDHVSWFKAKLADPLCSFYLAVDDEGASVGQIRLERTDNEVVMSVSLDPLFRGGGLGSKIIEAGASKYFSTAECDVIHAYIKSENEASRKAFHKAGFRPKENTIRADCPAVHLELRKEDTR